MLKHVPHTAPTAPCASNSPQAKARLRAWALLTMYLSRRRSISDSSHLQGSTWPVRVKKELHSLPMLRTPAPPAAASPPACI